MTHHDAEDARHAIPRRYWRYGSVAACHKRDCRSVASVRVLLATCVRLILLSTMASPGQRIRAESGSPSLHHHSFTKQPRLCRGKPPPLNPFHTTGSSERLGQALFYRARFELFGELPRPLNQLTLVFAPASAATSANTSYSRQRMLNRTSRHPRDVSRLWHALGGNQDCKPSMRCPGRQGRLYSASIVAVKVIEAVQCTRRAIGPRPAQAFSPYACNAKCGRFISRQLAVITKGGAE